MRPAAVRLATFLAFAWCSAVLNAQAGQMHAVPAKRQPAQTPATQPTRTPGTQPIRTPATQPTRTPATRPARGPTVQPTSAPAVRSALPAAASVRAQAHQETGPASQPAAATGPAKPTGYPNQSPPRKRGDGQRNAAPHEAASRPALLCPVTNAPIDPAHATRFRGRWVYFASHEALEKFTADPLEYAEGVQAQWAANQPLRAQVRCPVTGQPPSPDIYTGLGEDAVFFASPEAREKWLTDPAAFQPKLAECYTFQSGCATCGMPIKPAAQRTFEGRAYFFCCDGCAGQFAQDPRRYLPGVVEQIRANAREYEARRSEKSSASQPAAAR